VNPIHPHPSTDWAWLGAIKGKSGHQEVWPKAVRLFQGPQQCCQVGQHAIGCTAALRQWIDRWRQQNPYHTVEYTHSLPVDINNKRTVAAGDWPKATSTSSNSHCKCQHQHPL